MPSLGIMGRTTMRRRQSLPTGGLALFYIDSCGDFGGSSLEVGTVKLIRVKGSDTAPMTLAGVERSLAEYVQASPGLRVRD